MPAAEKPRRGRKPFRVKLPEGMTWSEATAIVGTTPKPPGGWPTPEALEKRAPKGELKARKTVNSTK